MAFKESYEKLAVKYKLPALADLGKELDVSGAEDDQHPLIFVAERVEERLDLWIEMLETVLSPDQGNSAALYEARFFSEKDHEDIFALFKRIMAIVRTLDEAQILADEKADAEAIRLAWAEWAECKKGVAAVVKKMRECWKQTRERDNVGYLG
jgi:hypothetical protein